MAGKSINPSSKLLLLLLSHFSHVQLCVTPETAAHQASQSLRFSRQEHWSGLPFPSPMHKVKNESEKWKWSRSVVSNSLWPHGLQPTRLLRPWDFPGKSLGVGCHCLLRHPISMSTQICKQENLDFFLIWVKSFSQSSSVYFCFVIFQILLNFSFLN